MEYILSTLVTAVVFVALILLLAAKPKISKVFTFAALGLGGICGLLIYGYGYAVVTDDFGLAILKAVLSVCRSFVGNNDYAEIAEAPFMQTQGMQILCTFVQICSLYATASAVITSIGATALKHLRLQLGRRKHLTLIYGANANSLRFGKQLATQKNSIVVFVDPQPSPDAVTAVSSMGCVLQSDPSAAAGSTKFLRHIGFCGGKRRLTLYALDENSNNNIRYAMLLLKSLDDMAVPAEHTRLVLMAQEEAAVSRLQQAPEKYGYGFVMAVNEPQMAARLLMMTCPPCSTVSFDENAKATENFEALLIGFGQVGQAVLKALVMNGQFEGSRFKLDVFAKDVDNVDGNFASQFGGLFEQYDINFHNGDARSRGTYDFLKQRADSLRCIVVSAGDQAGGHEIAEEIISFLGSIGRDIPLYKCTRQGVAVYNSDGTIETDRPIYCTELLCSHTLDERAMLLNHRYQPESEKTALQNWMECDYFSRQSCRAAADFIPAVLCAAGKSAEQVIEGDWTLSDAQIDNLSRTEHLRWCAFHYCMGFTAMDDAEFSARAEIYREQKEQGGKPTVRIGKNMLGKTHACLIPWEELDALSAKEAAVTGKSVDYKAMDTANVMAVPQLLQATEK
jgi:hypothetical protein